MRADHVEERRGLDSPGPHPRWKLDHVRDDERERREGGRSAELRLPARERLLRGVSGDVDAVPGMEQERYDDEDDERGGRPGAMREHAAEARFAPEARRGRQEVHRDESA